MKIYLLYWLSSYGGGHVIVSVDDKDISNPMKYAIDHGMNKAKTICQTAEFFKLEELNTNESGVVWINEWYD